MIKFLKTFLPALLLSSALVLGGCAVEQTREGSLPDVDVTAEEGQLPQYDVEAADVDVTTEEREVAVPDVDVNTEKETVAVPDVDVNMPETAETETEDADAATR